MGTGCLSSTLPPCLSSLGALGLSRSPSLGLFFAGLGCPPGGAGVGRKGGEKEQLCQHNPRRLCSCPPGPGCHPFLEGPVPGHNGDPGPGGTSSPGTGPAGQYRLLYPHSFSICPAAEHLSQKGLRADADPWFHFTDRETEARRKDLAAQGHSTQGASPPPVLNGCELCGVAKDPGKLPSTSILDLRGKDQPLIAFTHPVL